MRNTFKEYHIFTPKEIEALWHKAIVVFDTSVLLDFYCFGEETLNDYYRVLREIKKRKQLWLPYQVGYEFFERRLGVISRQLNQYDNLVKLLDGTKDKIVQLATASPNHSQLDFSEIAQQYEKAVSPIKLHIEKLKKAHPDHPRSDRVLAEFESIFDDSIIGQPYDSTQLEKVFEEGERRYAKRIPPGYRDESKKDNEEEPVRNRKFGDLVIWKQMLEKAKEINLPLILITNDAKEDWVLRAKDDIKLGPQPSLKKEVLEEANVDFMLYSSAEFLDKAHQYYNLPVKAQSVDEVKKYSDLEMNRRNMLVHGKPMFERLLANSPKEQYMRYEVVHEYVHEAQKIAGSCVHRSKGQLPEEAFDNLSNLWEAYGDIHRLIKRSTDKFGFELFRVEKLLLYCLDLLLVLKSLELPEIDALYSITRKIVGMLE